MYLFGHNLISELQLATRETGKCRLDSGWLWDQLKIRNSVSTTEWKNIYWEKPTSFCYSQICISFKSLAPENYNG